MVLCVPCSIPRPEAKVLGSLGVTIRVEMLWGFTYASTFYRPWRGAKLRIPMVGFSGLPNGTQNCTLVNMPRMPGIHNT